MSKLYTIAILAGIFSLGAFGGIYVEQYAEAHTVYQYPQVVVDLATETGRKMNHAGMLEFYPNGDAEWASDATMEAHVDYYKARITGSQYKHVMILECPVPDDNK